MQAEAEARRERSRARKFRALAIGAVALLAVGVGLAIFGLVERHSAIAQKRAALQQQQRAITEAQAAVAQRRAADQARSTARSQALAAEAMQELPVAPVTALAESVRAVETSATSQSQVALRRAILANPIKYVIPATDGGGSQIVDRSTGELTFNDDGRLLLTSRPDGTLDLRRSASGRRVTTRPKADRALFGPRDSLLSTDAGVIRAGPRLPRLPCGERGSAGRPPSFVSADGRFVATPAELWSVDGPRRLASLNASIVAFSPDGRFVVAVGPNGQARIYQSSSGRLIAALPDSGDLLPTGGRV